MKVRIKNIIGSIVLMAAVILLPLIAFADESLPVEVNVGFGIEDNAKGNRYLPLKIRYVNNTAAPFEGILSVYTRESDDKICEYRYEITLDAGENPEKIYYIPLGIYATGIHIKLEDSLKQVLLERDINLGIDTNNAKLFIGVLSDTPENLSYLDDVSVNYGLIRTRTFTLDTENFPTDSKGLDMLDTIIVTNYTIRDLDEYQSHALMEWVRNGGVLILGTGLRADDTLGRYAPELLDDMYDDPEIGEVELLPGLQAESADGYAELYTVDVAIHGGNVISENQGAPLLTSVNKEGGLIVIASYDLADVTGFAAEHPTYATDLITRSMGNERLNALVGELYGLDNSEYDSISTLVSTGDMSRIPPLGLYALSIIAFILLAGPGLYLFLKSRELSGFYRIGVIILSVGFTFIIFVMGARTRFRDTFYNYAKIIDLDEDTVKETSFLNLRNPYNKNYEVNIIPGYETYPVKTKEASGRVSGDWNDPIDVSTVISNTPEGTTVGIGEVGAFIPQYFKLEKTGDNAEGEGAYGYVNLFGNELDGSITNECSYDLKDAVLMFYGKMVVLGDIPAGETIELTEKKVINVPLSESEEVAYLVTDDKEKVSVMAFYRDYYMKGYTADANLLAFRESEDEPIIIDADLNGSGVSLVSSAISVDSYKDEQLYRSVLVKNPAVIRGVYDVYSNTMEVAQPCILEYQLGTDMEAENLVIERADKSSFRNAFDGTIAFYNYSTGGYDAVDPERSVYSINELSEYLSPSATITIRYDYSGQADDFASLPMICVVGMVY